MLWFKQVSPELIPVATTVHDPIRGTYVAIRWKRPDEPMPAPQGRETEWVHLTTFLDEKAKSIYEPKMHRFWGKYRAISALIQVAEALPKDHPLRAKVIKTALLHSCLIENKKIILPENRAWLKSALREMGVKLPPPPEPQEHPPLKLEQQFMSYDDATRVLWKQWESEPKLKDWWFGSAKERYGSGKSWVIKDGIVSTLTDKLMSDKEFIEAYINSPLNYAFATLEDALKDKEALRQAIYGVVDGLVGVWAQTASDEHPLAWALQIAIAQEFGLTESYEFLRKMLQELDEEAPNIVAETAFLYDTLKPLLHKYVRAVYEVTQEFLAQSGLEELWLIRGVALPREWTEPLQEDDFNAYEAPFLPASSWALSVEVAESFAVKTSRERFGTEPVTYLIRIPKEAFPNIISTALTGWGCLDETELVLLSSGRRQVLANIVTNEYYDEEEY
jgi:hypothetical protein